jgi:hypothetical protein
MDLAIALGITLLVGIALGAIGVHYIHNVASAATRAVTVPGSAAATTPAVVSDVAASLQKQISDLEAKLAAAAPKV